MIYSISYRRMLTEQNQIKTWCQIRGERPTRTWLSRLSPGLFTRTNANTAIETVTRTVTTTAIRNSCRSFSNDFTRCWMNSFLCLMCHALDLNPNAWNQMTESEFGRKLQDYKEIKVHNTSSLVVDYVRNKVAPNAITANG